MRRRPPTPDRLELRRAGADDAPALSRILLEARRAAGAQFPPAVHEDHELEPWLRDHVLADHEVWVAQTDGAPLGVLVLERSSRREDDLVLPADLIGQLSVLPEAQGTGVGGVLLGLAKRLRPQGLDLWVFASNTRARSFYHRHGFRVVGGTASDNEEGAPDLLMRWLPEEDA